MANYIHLFRCIRCSGFVEYKNKSDDCNDAPSVHHDELAEFVNKKKTVVNCTGRLLYYSTRLVEIPVYIAAPVDEEWKMFENTVSASWRIYVNSGYNKQFRGPNHDKAYKPSVSVSQRLQNAGGSIIINGARYTIAPSLTTHVSLHRALPLKHHDGNIQSFVFHL